MEQLTQETDTASLRALAERVAASTELASSPKLCAFFLHVVDCALRNCPEDATEQQIGILVFGRQPGFNSSDDSVVRSQARLLRLKLASYFGNDGANEPWSLKYPKGHYLPVFQKRSLESKVDIPDGKLTLQGLEELPARNDTEHQVPDQRLAVRARNRWVRDRIERPTFSLAVLTVMVLAIGFLGGALSSRSWYAPKVPERDPCGPPLWQTKRRHSSFTVTPYLAAPH